MFLKNLFKKSLFENKNNLFFQVFKSFGKFVCSVKELSFFQVPWNDFKSYFLKNDKFFNFCERSICKFFF